MKIKDGYKLSKVRDSYIVVALGDAVLDLNGIVSLNDTGAYIWRELEKGCTVEELYKSISEEFGTTVELVKADTDEFIAKLKGANFIE